MFLLQIIVNVRVAGYEKKVQGSCIFCVVAYTKYTMYRENQVFTHTKRVKSNPLRQTNYVHHKIKNFCPTCITNLV